MSLSDPRRHRQALLEGLSDDGLEELAVRLVIPDYPQAHRIRGVERRENRERGGARSVIASVTCEGGAKQ